MRYGIYISLIILLLTTSCGEYEKVLKSTDYDLKKAKAYEYFEEGRYVRATELLAQVIPRYRATEQVEELSWIASQCYYNMRDYMTASAAYRNFSESYPYSEHAEEASFMTAFCDYKLSPRPELDQAYSMSAIEQLQYFLRRFPSSDRAEEARDLIKELEDKLVEKSFLSARLYYDMEQYRAAIVALSNSLKEYPETKHREELLFLKLESNYQYASRSISDKQMERYQDTLDEYYSFIEEFPESEFKNDVEKIYSETARYLKLEEGN